MSRVRIPSPAPFYFLKIGYNSLSSSALHTIISLKLSGESFITFKPADSMTGRIGAISHNFKDKSIITSAFPEISRWYPKQSPQVLTVGPKFFNSFQWFENLEFCILDSSVVSTILLFQSGTDLSFKLNPIFERVEPSPAQKISLYEGSLYEP